MPEDREMSKPLRDLVDITHFTQGVSAKIHGILDEAEVYRTVKREFAKSKRYDASVLLLTDDGSGLVIAETSMSADKRRVAEKAARRSLKGFKIDLSKSNTYSQVVREGKTLQVNVGNIIGELFPRPLAKVISKTAGYDQKDSILTPLKRHGKTIGALAMSSTQLFQYFVPSVRSLAQHISAALELADEYADRKEAEEALKESEEKYRTLVEQTPDVIYSMDGSGNIISVNEAIKSMFGFEPEEVVGRNFVEFAAEEVRSQAIADRRQLLSGGRLTTETTMIDKEGKRHDVEYSSVPIVKDGQVVGTQGIVRDITERKKAAEEISSCQNRIESLINSSSDLIFLKDSKFRYLVANEVHEKVFNVKVKDIIGKTDFDFMPRQVARGCRRSDMEALKRGFISQEERVGEKFFEVIKQRVVDAEGGVVGIAAIIRDITRRKEAEEALRETQKRLWEQNLLLEDRNVALKELMAQVKGEKQRIEDQIQTNVQQLLLPLLGRLRERGSTLERTYVDLLEENLKELTSPFGSRISSGMHGLTQREVQICNMIRGGLTSKQIGRLLKVSHRTAEAHRNNIRKKLGLKDRPVNLATYLRTL